MGTPSSSLPGGKLRLGIAVLTLSLALSVTVACTQTVRGKASLPRSNTDLAHDPQITNIGVDAPVSTSKQRSSKGSDASGTGLGDYLDAKGISIFPVAAGQGLTATLQTPPAWRPEKSDSPEVQVQSVLPASDGDGLMARVIVTVFKLSANPPDAELVSSAKNSIASDGNIQSVSDDPYRGSPSIAGIVQVTTKQGNHVTEVVRYTFVKDQSSSATYIVNSTIICATDDWDSMRNDLLRLDNSVNFKN